MKEVEKKRLSPTIIILLILTGLFVFFFIVLPVGFLILFSNSSPVGIGNVALIPITGQITGNGGKILGSSTASAHEIVDFLDKANKNPQVKAIVLEINSPGGSAVASDEVAAAVKKSDKPVVAWIREVGASGGYWIASASEHIVAHRMAITGSIGVISSYIEFSGAMDKYGLGYERLVAGKYKDVGTPFRKLENEERKLLEKKLDRIHNYFISEVSSNRDLSKKEVKALATGEFYLGIEAFELGLVDELGDKTTVENYLKNKHSLTEIDYITYQRKVGFLEIVSGVFHELFFSVGEGMSAVVYKSQNDIRLM
jgi:protease IV